jgi:hypothetical protein
MDYEKEYWNKDTDREEILHEVTGYTHKNHQINKEIG